MVIHGVIVYGLQILGLELDSPSATFAPEFTSLES